MDFSARYRYLYQKEKPSVSDAAVLAMIDRNRDATEATSTTAASKGQDRYRVYTNAKNKYTNFGGSLGATYIFYKTFTVSGNLNYNKMKANKTNDIFVTAFNTPEWSTNLSFGNRELTKHVGFSVAYRWQKSFLWESPLVTGQIDAINTFDAQVTYRAPKLHSTFKLGEATFSTTITSSTLVAPPSEGYITWRLRLMDC